MMHYDVEDVQPALVVKKLAMGMGGHYKRCLQHPIMILIVMVGLCAAAVYQLPNLQFDASSDTLIAKGDPQLAYYNQFAATFAERPFLVLTYTPREGRLLSRQHIERLEALVKELAAVDAVAEVQSLLDAPLLRSPPVPLSELANGFRTLQSADADLTMAREELTASPLFSELLISRDGQTTAIRINLQAHSALEAVRSKRDELLAQAQRDKSVSAELAVEEEQFRRLLEEAKASDQRTIAAVRAIRDRHADLASMYLGGVPMVAADMIEFVKGDMATFGGVILILLIIALYLFFRRMRWVLIPLGSTAVTLLLMTGALAALGQPVTVVSVNFVPLVAIITISFTIHLTARYRELYAEYKDDAIQCTLAYETMQSKLQPCLYTALTTIVAFASLMTSGIVPVIDFGWMMCLGIVISLLVTYSFFASVLVLLPKNESPESLAQTPRLTRWFARAATEFPLRVVAAAGLAILASFVGMQQLEIGNRLVEYFRADTEIRQGLNFIDQHLGGTIPLDVVLKFEPFEPAATPAGDDFVDEFAQQEPDPYPQRFWYTPEKLAVIDRMQSFLEAQPALGKSVSLASLERVARTFNDDEPLSYVLLTTVISAVPQAVRDSLIAPYASPATGEVRVSSRLHETGPAHDLNTLIESIEAFAVDELGVPADNVTVTGVAVLFSSMLEQLVQSQLSTLLFVVVATFAMFAILLRSFTLALIGLAPNLLAAGIILAFMGYAGIPLDIMTITIAAIVIGIGVDDAIHYLHRFKEEVDAGQSTISAVRATHGSIGKALYFTSLIVVIGFSVLVFSRFVPTAYFGWLAALAMLVALTANLALLPALLVKTYR